MAFETTGITPHERQNKKDGVKTRRPFLYLLTDKIISKLKRF